MNRCQLIERSIIKKYRKTIWNNFIGGLKDYQMIQAGDRIEWSSMTFEIDGAPMPWTSPTGRVSHIWARLKEWSG